MINGALVTMAGQLMADLNKGTEIANQLIKDMLNAKISVVGSLAEATRAAGENQAYGQLIMGVVSIIGGVAGILGGCAGLYGAVGELGALNNLDRLANQGTEEVGSAAKLTAVDDLPLTDMGNGEFGVEMQDATTFKAPVGEPELSPITSEPAPDTTSPDADFNTQQTKMTDQEKAFQAQKIAKDWQKFNIISNTLSSAAPGLFNGGGQIANSGYTATAAQQQAASQIFQGTSDAVGQQTGGTEGVVSSSQNSFGTAANLPQQFMQYLLALSQAH